MSDKSPTLLPAEETSRDRLRALLTVLCVVAVVLAGTVVPAVPGGSLGQTPLGSVVPQHEVDLSGQSSGGARSAAGGAAGGLGALNPGDQTSVGGSLADDENAFRSQDTDVHFTVQSTTPAYWRTGAYDTYTGSGWEQSGERQPYDGAVEGDGIRGREVEYRMRLNRSATALPSVWRPTSLSGGSGVSEESLFVTDRRAFVTDDPAPAGTTYSGVSHLAPQDPDVLRTAGRDYPADLERRYTALPEDSQDLAQFTDRLTADADSPYETATRVENWLESNKNYSLDAPAPSDDVASQFVFDMENGYCEYFATAMTVMLRTQGIPARYTVGYSTGQQVGANTYDVRGMNAHAWVEVYFPEVGWVKFDPTPGQDRLQTEQQAFDNQTDDTASDYEPSEQGSPGEEFSPNESDESIEESGFDGPATDETVPENGTVAGDGTTDATAPTATDSEGTPESDVTIDPDVTQKSERPTDSDTSTTAASRDGTTDSDRTTTDSDQTTTDSSSSETTDSSTTETTDPTGEESAADTAYTVELNRTPVPGGMVEVTVRKGQSVVSGVPVFFDGEQVGTTGEDGTVTARVPYTRNLTITLGRVAESASQLFGPPPAFDAPMSLTGVPPRVVPPDSIDDDQADWNTTGGNTTDENTTDGNTTDGNTTDENTTGGNTTEYDLATNATLSVSGDIEVGTEVVVTATVEDVAVRNADVRLDGERVGTTDRNGRVTVRLPESPGNATLAVERGPVAGETTVSVPRLNVSVDPVLPLALPGTPVEICATYDGDPVSEAQVQVGGTNQTTDFNGSATATLPFQGNANVLVSAHGQTRQTAVSGLFANLAGLLGGLALLLGGFGYGAAQRGYGPRRLVALLLAGLRAIPGFAMAVLFAVAAHLERTIGRVLTALREIRAGETPVEELLARFRTWLRAVLRRCIRAAQATANRAAAGVTGARDQRQADSDDSPDDSYRTLRTAWAEFLDFVSARNPDSMTPGELAAYAIREDDLPSDAVLTLRDAFRDVEYGARSPADRLPRVETAIETIERSVREATEAATTESDHSPGKTATGTEQSPDKAPTESKHSPDDAATPGGDD